MTKKQYLQLNNEWQGKINILANQIRLEVSEAKLAIDRPIPDEPNIPMALRRLEAILEFVSKVATTKDKWN